MKKSIVCVLIALSLLIITLNTPANAYSTPTGLWYATLNVTEGAYEGYSNVFSINFVDSPYGLLASMYIPELGLFDDYLPVSINGNIVTIGDPAFAVITGELVDNSLAGTFSTPLGNGNWEAEKYIDLGVLPSNAPGQPCDDLPPLYCMGDSEYCSELVQFTPESGDGYINQTYEEFRYIRRDLMMLIKYASAKIACKTADWDYGNKGALGLIDMSEEGGLTPGATSGFYRHPLGTHENGKDIDTAYFQLYSTDNLARLVGLNYDNHLVEPPYNLDKWRTALYISYLAEHPRVRVIGVDGQIGLIFDGPEGPNEIGGTFDELVDLGWIDSDLRDSIPLAYEVEDYGYGWFRFHHHHMHVSMNPIASIVSSLEINPDTLNRNNKGNKVTAHIEFNGDIDIYQLYLNSVGLIINGFTMLYVQPDDIKVSDYNQNGIDDLTIKFDRQKVLESIGEGDIEVSITGLVGNKFFQESDMVRVIGHPIKASQKKSKPVIPFNRPGGRMFWPE